MTGAETRTTVLLTSALAGLALLQGAAQSGYRLPGLAGEVVKTMANRDLNKEGREALTAGYYEGLINEGSRLGGMNALVTDSRRFEVEDEPSHPDRRRIRDFRYYELIPNADVPDYADEKAKWRLKTSSAGLADREYPLTPAPGTRRLALFGDSITRGQGAPHQENYEALLESALNEERSRAGQPPLEILNFAVGSYSLMQMMDTAITRAAAYKPDVYVIALTDRCVYRAWGHHLAYLLQEGIDLKYDYLKQVVREAGVTGREPRGVFDARLARHRLPTIRWALQMVKDHAERNGAEVLVLMIPTADDPALLEEEFLGVRQVLADMRIPVLDVLDTFADMPDRSSIRVADRDRHPNREGHRMLFEALLRKLPQSEGVHDTVHGAAAVLSASGPS